VPLAQDADPGVRRAAVEALGDLKDRTIIPTLLEAYRDPLVRSAALVALVRMPDVRALDAYLDGLDGRDATLREGCRRAVAALGDKVLPTIESRADRLPPDAVAQLRQVYEGHAAARRGRLFAVAAKAPMPEEYLRFAREHPGESSRGRGLFRDREGLGCIKCH